MVRPPRTGPSATCLSQVPGGDRGHDSRASSACQCVSLAFRFGGDSQQLPAFWNGREKKSVTSITVASDDGQSEFEVGCVFRLTVAVAPSPSPAKASCRVKSS